MNKYLKRQLKKRDKRLKYDFLPPMIEIIEKPANYLGVIIMYVIISLIAVTICWACFAKLDVVVTASGAVNTENALVTLSAITTGNIKDVKVKDGEHVNEGDVICTFVSDVSEATLKEYEYNLNILNTQKDIYEKIYEKYKEDDYTTLNIDLGSYGENKRFAEAIILENDIFIKKLSLLDENDASLAKSNQLLSVMQNLNNIDTKIESVSTELKAGQKDLEDKTIVAPISGIYSLQNKLYAGKNVVNGDVLGYILPDENLYEFTAYVSDKDISQINVGDKVKVKMAAFNDTQYEYIDGEIASVGNIPVNIENIGVSYVVNIKLYSFPDNIKTGMEGNIDIIIGTRTVMDYFLEPCRKGIKDSLREK